MVRSMTGYGKAEGTAGKRKITVEVRSLNSKQLDLSLRLPQIYRMHDHELRSLAARELQRGKADLYINVETEAGAAGAVIDKEVFGNYYRQLRAAGEHSGMEWGTEENAATIQALMRMPDVVKSESDDADDSEIETLFATVEKALHQLNNFRQMEGMTLIADIVKRVDIIDSLLGEVRPHEERRTEVIRTRILDSIDKLNVAVDSNRLEQEMVFYIEKLDITEEKVRLAQHCSYFREVVDKEDNPGRKLGFISQEMGREINTLGSKANDASIQRVVVEMKDELEKIKEQLLNIL